nr:hypothetical protein BaRGS_025365 [Batillaria attramentaria]
MMGVYLAVIGVADRLYMGDYLWNDVMWKGSVFCKAAGFLALVSCEVSAFIITLITLDRILVIRFPFSELHFRKFSANLACAVVWVVCGILAVVPLFPVTSHWEFYSQTGICLPLPITRNDFPGHSYSFSIMIILNFVLFVVIATGQVFVYWSVRANVMAASDTTRQSQDLTIARRLITVAASDFLCWFPIGLLGMLAVEGMPIPGEVNVAIAIFVLPLNSALNPFLYNLNMILERRRKRHEEHLKKVLLGLLEAKMAEKEEENETSYTKEEACALLKDWLFHGVLSEDRIHSYFQDAPTHEVVM